MLKLRSALLEAEDDIRNGRVYTLEEARTLIFSTDRRDPMENVKFCQSCASPLTKPEDFGTEADGSKSSDYCCPCYENGSLYGGDGMKMEEMIELCAPYAVQAGKYKDADEARTAMREFFPKLKRWASA